MLWIVAAFAAAGLASASIFQAPLGTYLLVNAPTNVQINASLPLFNTSRSYWLEDSAAVQTSCAVKGPTLISCILNETSEGDAVYKLGEGVSVLDIVVIRVYAQPTVQTMSVTQLPTSGGTRLTLTLAGSGLKGTGGIPRFENIRARFVKACCRSDATCCGVLGEVSMGLDGANFGIIKCRSPQLSVAVGTQVEVHLAINGRTFQPTGKTAAVVQKDKLKLGFIYVGAPDDFGWTFQHNLARLGLEARFFGQIETVTKDHIEEWGPNKCVFCTNEPGWNSSLGKWSDEAPELFGTHSAANVIKEWVEQEGVKMIFATSFYYQFDTLHMAMKYPNVNFVHVGAWKTHRNMAQVFPKVYQARYLSGIALAWYIKKHNLPKKIGFVSSFALGETSRAINALKLGMEKVDPEIDIYLTWALSWYDPRKENVATRRLIRYYGVEGIAQHTDSRAPQLAARDEGKMGCGYNTDMLLTVGDSVLTSPILIWGNMYANLVQKVLDGDYDEYETTTWTGFESGSTRLSSFSPLVPPEAQSMIAEEQAKLESGVDMIFCKPNMIDNKGRLRNGPVNPAVNPVPWEAVHLREPDSTCLTDNVVNQVCQEYVNGNCNEHWLLAGVHDQCGPSPRKPSGIRSPDLPAGTCFLGSLDLPDVCPAGQVLQIIGCKNASIGHFARDEREFPCDPGYFSTVEGMSACSPCPSGSYSNAAGASDCTGCAAGMYSNTAALSQCVPCGPGLFSGKPFATQCDFCFEGAYAEFEGTSACKVCPVSTTTPHIASVNATQCLCEKGTFGQGFGSLCSACPAGSSTEGIGSKDKGACICDEDTYMKEYGSACLPCPETMTCPRGSSVANFAMYSGQAKDDLYKQYPLLKVRYWSSAVDPMSVFECESTAQCIGGDPGNSCCAGGLEGQACQHCPQGSMWDGKLCKLCSQAEVSPFVFPILPILIMPVILVGMYRQFGDTYGVWGSWKNGVTSAVFIVLNHYQIIVLFGDVNIELSKPQLAFFQGLQFTSNVASIFRPQCSGFGDFKSSTIVRAILPAGVIIIAVVTYSVFCAISMLAKRPFIAMDKNRLTNVVLSLMLTFFAGICGMCFTLFKCSLNPNSKHTLTADRAVNCYEDDWNGLVGVAVVAILVWCGGFGLLFGWAIVKSPEKFADPGFQMRWKFLFIKYRPDVHWWSLAFILKGILLNIGFLIFSSAVGQIYWLIAVLIFYLSAAIAFRPWRHVWVNILDIWSHACIILDASTLIWFAAISAPAADLGYLNQNMARFTIACGFLLVPCIVPVLGYVIWWGQSRTAKAKRQAIASDFHMICNHVALQLPMVDFVAWADLLSEMDMAYLTQARGVLAQELLHIKSRTGYSSNRVFKISIKQATLTSTGIAQPNSQQIPGQPALVFV